MKRQNKIRKKGEVGGAQPTGSAGSGGDIMRKLSQQLTLRNLKYAVAAVVVLLLALVYFRSKAVIQNLNNTDVETLKQAIFGEMPYLFFCDRVGKAENIPAVFSELNNLKGSTMGFAAVNCSQKLPSGKTLWERFKLKREIRPTIWGSAPWMKAPQQVTATFLKDTKSLQKFTDTVMAPKATDITNDKDLAKFCGFDKATATSEDDITGTCLVLLRGKMHSKVHADLERRLVLGFPKTRIAALDANKRRLSFEEEDTIMEMLPAESFALKMFALRNGTHYMSMVNPITWDYMNTFATRAVSSALYDYVATEKKKAITIVKSGGSSSGGATGSSASNDAKMKQRSKGKKAGKTSRQQRQQNPQQSQQSGETTDDSNQQQDDDAARTEAMQEAVRAAAKAAQAKRERQRREEMERQQREFFAADEVPEDEAEGDDESADDAAEEDGDDDDDDEDDIIEL